MKKGRLLLLCSFLLGVGLFPLAFGITKLGKVAAAKECLLLFTGLAFTGASVAIWDKYKLGMGAPNPALMNPDMRELFTRFPFLLWVAPLFTQLFVLCIGIVVSIFVFQLLVSAVG